MPSSLPDSLKDIEEFLSTADTITYIAEFFRDCVEAIRVRLGPPNQIVQTVGTELKTKSSHFHQSILENTVHGGDSFKMNAENSHQTLKTLKYYYSASSLKNIGRGVTKGLKDQGKMLK